MGGMGRKPMKVPPSRPGKPHAPPPKVIDQDKDLDEALFGKPQKIKNPKFIKD